LRNCNAGQEDHLADGQRNFPQSGFCRRLHLTTAKLSFWSTCFLASLLVLAVASVGWRALAGANRGHQRGLSRALGCRGDKECLKPRQYVPNRKMAWRSTGATHAQLVANLKAHNIIQSDKVFDVMSKVDRGDFSSRDPYVDSPQSIGYGVTISAPHMVIGQ